MQSSSAHDAGNVAGASRRSATSVAICTSGAWPHTTLASANARRRDASPAGVGAVVEVVERQRDGAGQRPGVGRVLRLVPAHPHHAVVDDEHREARSAPRWPTRDLDQDRAAFGLRVACVACDAPSAMTRAYRATPCRAAGVAGASTTPPPPCELLADVVAGRQEPPRQRRQRRHLVRVERPHQARRDDARAARCAPCAPPCS